MKKVLIISENSDTREYLHQILTSQGDIETEVVEVRAVDNVVLGTMPDLIILDITTADVSVTDATGLVRKRWEEEHSSYPYLWVIGKDDAISAAEALEADADDYMRDFVSSQELMTKINRVFKKNALLLLRSRRKE